MANKLRECIMELHKNYTGKEVAEALSEYFQTVRDVAAECTDKATAWDLRRRFPALSYMLDDELEGALEQAKALRHIEDFQEPARPERELGETDERSKRMDGLFRKRMEATQRRERAMILYMHTVVKNRNDEEMALLNALEDKSLEAFREDCLESRGDERL